MKSLLFKLGAVVYFTVLTVIFLDRQQYVFAILSVLMITWAAWDVFRIIKKKGKRLNGS